MNPPEHELARSIVRHLDYGVDHLEPAVRERLLAARRTALSKYREQPATVASPVWAAQAAARVTEHRFHGARHLIAISALVLALVGVAYWQSVGTTNSYAEIDSDMLTDELPINAYLDKGFDSWLKRSSR
jgi:ADP-glucose pyrophosphorylase